MDLRTLELIEIGSSSVQPNKANVANCCLLIAICTLDLSVPTSIGIPLVLIVNLIMRNSNSNIANL